MQDSTLTASSSSIDGNAAANNGDGLCAQSLVFDTSSITLIQSASANSNTAATWGGGLYMQASTLTASSSSIDGNMAGDDGGGVNALSSSSITLSQGASANSDTIADN